MSARTIKIEISVQIPETTLPLEIMAQLAYAPIQKAAEKIGAKLEGASVEARFGILAANQPEVWKACAFPRKRGSRGPVEFCSRDYVLSHGKEPRGRGGWAFEVSKASVDMAALRVAVGVWNTLRPANSASARLDEELYPELALVWMPSSTFASARKGAREIFSPANKSAGSLLVKVAT